MNKLLSAKVASASVSFDTFQRVLGSLDIVGRWDWDATTDIMRSDAIVAMLYNVDPEAAKAGVPISVFQAAVHPDDRDRLRSLSRRCTWDSSLYLAEYRVISIDGRIRWLLVSGRFASSEAGEPLGGSGFIVDITQLRASEERYPAIETSASATLLDRAAELAIATQQVIAKMQDPALKAQADVLLMELGRRLARQEVEQRRRLMN